MLFRSYFPGLRDYPSSREGLENLPALYLVWPAQRKKMTPRLALKNISKSYPAVVANDGVDLTVQPGEIHAVLGENGAGQPTLMKVLYGVTAPDAGQMFWNGQQTTVLSHAAGRTLGEGKSGKGTDREH